MDKRTILAFFLCFLVLIGFQVFYGPPPAQPTPRTPPGQGPDGGEAPSAPTGTAAPAPTPPPAGGPAPVAVEAERKEFALENPVIRARLASEGAEVRSIELKELKAEDQKSALELLAPWRTGASSSALGLQASPVPAGVDLARAVWPAAADGRAVTFRYPAGEGLSVEKVVTLSEDGYHFDVRVRLANASDATIAASYTLIGAEGITPDDEQTPVSVVVGVASGSRVKLTTADASKIPAAGADERKEWTSSTYGGISSKYFAMALVPLTADLNPTFFVESILGPFGPSLGKRPVNLRSGYRVRQVNVGPHQTVEHRYLFFAGPKDAKVLASYENVEGRLVGLPTLVDLTSVIPLAEGLSNIFLRVLHAFYTVVGSYGIAIILLTVLVRVALHPLSRASQRSMYKMQKLAPLVKKIQDKYKDRKTKEAMQKMNVEIMELYKAHGANPIAGCLPMFLQLPVFIGLYNALAYSIELRQTHFLWIQDLTKPDRLLHLPLGFNLPWPLENYLNLLPILMVATMVLQQKLQPPPPDPQQLQQQKVMGYMMLLFGFLFYTVPSGLVLYFVTSSVLGIIETKWIRRQLEAESAHGGLPA